ncbi:SETD6-like protein [Mya arenaria]|uniref:N-lysine methyltransferase SETD6 n=1 Tax=Mya arenaria TaxID=6604 RepID=A0ABY7E1E6_MYAAR|nr:SETD6-like protein [Mya arenaria]
MAAPMKRNAEEIVEGNVSVKKRKANENFEKLNDFAQWIQKNNFMLSDKVKVSQEGSCAQYGLVAVDDISADEMLFQIPRSLLLNPDTCGIAKCLKEDSKDIAGTSGWVPTLLALMYEYTNPESPWRPYLDLVPDFSQLDLPMFWSKSERVDLLQGSGVAEAVRRDLANMEDEFNSVVRPFVRKHKDKFSPECESLEFYKRMVAFVMAYSFTEPLGLEEGEESAKTMPMMVPLADILNHVANNNAHLKFEKNALKMVATCNIKKDEEVFNTYGELANWHLLHMYGFAQPHPHNHWDTSLYGEDVGFIVGVDGILDELEMTEVLKVSCLDEDEVDRRLADDGWESDDEEDGDPALTYDSMDSLQGEWKSVLKRGAELTLGRYGSAMSEDQTKLGTMDLTSRQRYALYTVHGQKQLLNTLINKCS